MATSSSFDSAIESLFPDEVVVLTATPDMWTGSLHPEEEVYVARAGAKRRREFTAGRNCARKALARLGIEGVALLRDDDRLPIWPAGVVGSITHRAGFCAVAVAREDAVCGLGLDAELAVPLSDGAIRQICRPGEVTRQRWLCAPDSTPWSSLLFSAKESAYKCYYPIGRQALSLRDLDVTLQPDAGSFVAAVVRPGAASAHGLRSFHGRYACCGDFVVTAVALTDAERRLARRRPPASVAPPGA